MLLYKKLLLMTFCTTYVVLLLCNGTCCFIKLLIKIHTHTHAHTYTTEGIRNMVRHLTLLDWTIHFGWVKAHARIEGNEMADTLAKEAAQNEGEQNIVYDRKPETTAASELKKEGIVKWQRQWEGTAKWALCRLFFPTVEQRLQVKLPSHRSSLLWSQVTERLSHICTDLN